MSDRTEIFGTCPPEFQAVRAQFQRHFDEGLELGARFSVCVEGEVVLDLWGGHADRAGARPFDQHTLAPLFSTSKAVTSLVVASAVDRGLLDYDQPLAEVWPEFAQAGKGAITFAQALSHQAGLSGLSEPADPGVWFDWPEATARIAAQAPIWPPGSASGYGPVTWGFVAGEAFRRVDPRGVGVAFAEDFGRPLNLDLRFRAADVEEPDLAELRKPAGPVDFGEINAATRAAFLQPWSPVNARDPRHRDSVIPSVSAVATAEALARLFNLMANDGRLDGTTWLSPDVIAAASRERIVGRDLVLPHVVSWGAGFTRGGPERMFGPNPDAFGHWGWGGSCAFADPERRLSASYVMNRQGALLVKDPRAMALIETLYASL